MSDLPISTGAGGVRLRIRVMPRSSRSKIDGIRNGCVVVRVTAPPVEGAANDAVLDLLATTLRLPRRALNLVLGETSREKTIVVAGLTDTEVRKRLGL